VLSAEVRALVLARLAPRPGVVIWDVGAGCGSVGIECARLGATVIAVEQDGAQCVRIVANAARYGVEIDLIDEAAPASLHGLPAPDAVFVGGGGPDVVRACASVGARRVVVLMDALDRISAVRNVLVDAGYPLDGCQVAVTRLTGLDRSATATRFAAADPVIVLWGDLKDVAAPVR
jgi:precorrin-6Y C5,15-methyltransferase (decarboxylating)